MGEGLFGVPAAARGVARRDMAVDVLGQGRSGAGEQDHSRNFQGGHVHELSMVTEAP